MFVAAGGDGRVALWLNAAPGSQQLHVGAQPKYFYVPPYVGPRGWLGVDLNKGLPWTRIAALVREAYEKIAPAELRARVGAMPVPKTPKLLTAKDIDPFKDRHAMAMLATLRKICVSLPETNPGTQFGNPTWLAGKRTFVIARFADSRLTFCFWVGIEQQGLLTEDRRYRIPPYFGHNGWISLDMHEGIDLTEVSGLVEISYRHFALKRMLRASNEL